MKILNLIFKSWIFYACMAAFDLIMAYVFWFLPPSHMSMAWFAYFCWITIYNIRELIKKLDD